MRRRPGPDRTGCTCDVELALGSEVRTFPLAEFTDFWLTMIEVGRQATSSYLDALAESARRRREEADRSSDKYVPTRGGSSALGCDNLPRSDGKGVIVS